MIISTISVKGMPRPNAKPKFDVFYADGSLYTNPLAVNSGLYCNFMPSMAVPAWRLVVRTSRTFVGLALSGMVIWESTMTDPYLSELIDIK